jgi:hypothetical protein
MGLGVARGGAVRIGGVGHTIGIAEGIETALAVRQLVNEQTGITFPVWAALSANGMQSVEIPYFAWTGYRRRSRRSRQAGCEIRQLFDLQSCNGRRNPDRLERLEFEWSCVHSIGGQRRPNRECDPCLLINKLANRQRGLDAFSDADGMSAIIGRNFSEEQVTAPGQACDAPLHVGDPCLRRR